MTKEELAKSIEYTLLKPTATSSMIAKLCEEARQYHFACVAVNLCWVPLCAELLKGSGVSVCTGIGFPLGTTATEIKVEETKLAIAQGANEVDVVINIGKAKEGDWKYVHDELAAIAAVAKSAVRPATEPAATLAGAISTAVRPASAQRTVAHPAAILKVILETCYLTDAEKVEVCKAALACGADYVKTSTGFGTAGAKVEDVRLMHATVGSRMKVKASGGIKTLDDALALLDAGAVRLGTSSGVSIMEEFERRVAN